MRKFQYGLAIGFILLVTQSAHTFCYEEAGAMYKVSPQLLWAISRAESDFNPQAINFNKNGTYDYGLMQINSSWREMIGHSAWGALSDPCYNTKVGAWILSDCINRNGYTWEAVGCYNAKSREKRKKYSARIYRIIRAMTP